MTALVIYDLEYTSWEGALERNWSGESEYREIVQIAAQTICAETLEPIKAPLDLLVKPTINPELSPYFTDLTGITQNMVEEDGLPFKDAAQKFLSYCHKSPYCSYGTDDDILNENRALYALKSDFLIFQGFDLRPWFESVTGTSTLPNSGALATYFDLSLPKNHHEHNALDDVNSIIVSARHLILEQGQPHFLKNMR